MDAYEIEMRTALGAMERSELFSADQHLREAARLRPEAAQPHYLLAANAAQLGHSDVAEASYRACLDRASDFSIARFQLALLQLVNGRIEHARATFEPLTSRTDDDYLKCFSLGLLAASGGDRHGAVSWIERGIERNSDIPALNQDMRGVLDRLGRSDAPDGQADVPARVDHKSDRDKADGSHFLISAYRQS